ncbi:hypothetical protein SynBOUM118_00407 [Synechococcus sp. BOUM118]|nr:hypothetical protein SynBOUM118_00407 [Synechococcus sp. BOUM118]
MSRAFDIVLNASTILLSGLQPALLFQAVAHHESNAESRLPKSALPLRRAGRFR